MNYKVKKLEWGEILPPDTGSYYDHVEAISPIGTYVIEWKSWKDYPGYVVLLNEKYIGNEDTLEIAKKLAQIDFDITVHECLEPKSLYSAHIKTLSCTPEHPLLTLKGWIPAKNLPQNEALPIYIQSLYSSIEGIE